MSNRVDNIVITLFSWILLTGLTTSYKGVLRQSNGTDIELRRWYKDLQRCGETFVVTQNQPILFDDETCGYTCLWQNGVPSSSNEVQPGGGLTCENDQNIRQDCNTGGIGSQIDQNKLIQVMTIADLDQEQTLYHLDKKLSRCEFIETSCGKVEYKDASSGTWKNTSLHTCFDISIQHENLSNSTAVLKVTCSDEKRKQMEGQLMKIQMKCHVDDEKKDYQTCFMFKVGGQSLVSEEKEDLEKVCIIPPTVPVTTLGPIISTTLGPIISSTNDPSSDDNDEGVPLYVIIIIIIIVILLIVIAIILYCCCYKRKRKSSETKTVNGIENASAVFDEPRSTSRQGNTSVIRPPPPPINRSRPNSVSGFKNPLFVGDPDTATTNTKPEYAKVNKQSKKQKPVNTQGNTLKNPSTGLYEEIPIDSNQNDTLEENRHNSSTKSNALKRPPSFGKGDYNPYSEIDDHKGDQGTTDKKKLNRIASGKGTLQDLPFDTTSPTTEKVPIYNNSSIPSTPITTLGDPVNLEENAQPIYNDAPLSNSTDTLSTPDELYQQPTSQRQPSSTDSIYNVPSSPVETYDFVPLTKKGNTKEKAFANYRRSVPPEINLKRLPFTFLDYTTRDPELPNHSSPAFYLLFANYYLQIKEEVEEMQDLMTKIPILMRTAEDMWSGLDDHGDGTTVDEAGYILKSSLRKQDIMFKLAEELSWNTEEASLSPFETLHSLYTKCIESTKRQCLVLTFHDRKTCICLFDGQGNQTFLDLNIHYKNNKQTALEALGDEECGGVIGECGRRHSDSMLNYILTNMCLEMNCTARSGNAVHVHHKHQNFGEPSKPADFI